MRGRIITRATLTIPITTIHPNKVSMATARRSAGLCGLDTFPVRRGGATFVCDFPVRSGVHKGNTSVVSSAGCFTLVQVQCSIYFIALRASFSSMHSIRCNHSGRSHVRSGRSASKNRITRCCSLPTYQITSTVPIVVAIAHAYTTRTGTCVKCP